MMGFLSDDWDPLEDADTRRAKKKAEAEAVAQAEGYDPQTTETKGSLLKPMAPWEREKAEQGTGEYWAKNILGINSLFRPDARKAHYANVTDYNETARKMEVAGIERDRKSEAAGVFNDVFTNGDLTDDGLGYLEARIAGLEADDLATGYYNDPMFQEAARNKSSREVLFQPKYRQREDGRYEAVQYSNMPGAAPQVTLMPEGFLPESALMDPDTVNQYISDYGDQKQARATELRATTAAIRQINDIDDKDWTAGLAGQVEGFGKEIFGDEDPESWAKRAASQVAQIEALKLLPPGPATDRDVSIVLDKVPGKNANKETWIEYLEAVQRLQQGAYDYAKAKGDYVGRNGRRGFVGFEEHWDSIQSLEPVGGSVPAQPAGETDAFTEERGPDLQDPAFLEWKKLNGYK